MEDQKLLQLLFDRSEKAVSALAQRFGNRLFRIAHNILQSHEDAEEVVNDTYLAVWNAIPPNRPQPLEGYVYRTGRNLALKRLRFDNAQKRSDGHDLSLEELAACIPDPAPDRAANARLLGQAIDRYLDTLPPLSRVLFLRRYWFGDRICELAREFSMTENAVSVRLSRIRDGLKCYLLKEGFFL